MEIDTDYIRTDGRIKLSIEVASRLKNYGIYIFNIINYIIRFFFRLTISKAISEFDASFYHLSSWEVET